MLPLYHSGGRPLSTNALIKGGQYLLIEIVGSGNLQKKYKYVGIFQGGGERNDEVMLMAVSVGTDGGQIFQIKSQKKNSW